MIEINTLKGEGFSGEFYKLHFQRLEFLLFPSPDLSTLTSFSQTKQKTLGKINVLFNMTSLLKHQHFFDNVHYILLTEFSQILYLPYLLRLIPQVTIIATNLTFQLARISLLTFHQIISDFDATRESVNFIEQSRVLDKYEQDIEDNLDKYRKLFSKEEIDTLLSKIIKVNYCQLFDTERGVHLRNFPSGKNNGSCFWQLKGSLSCQKILLINELSQYNWRSCQSFSIERLKQSQQQDPYKLVIYTKRALEQQEEGEEIKLAETIRRINLNANMGISSTIVLQDHSLCIDLIPRLAVTPQGSILYVILGHNFWHSFHNFINSYVDYLAPFYKDQIFTQNPEYPLVHYSKLREKGFLMIGSLEELAIKKKLPLKEIMLQTRPFVRFITDYEYNLEIDEMSKINQVVKHEVQKISLGSNFNDSLLNQFLRIIKPQRIIGFQHKRPEIDSLDIGKAYNLFPNSDSPFYLMTHNYTSKTFQPFILKDNELEIKQNSISYLKIARNWTEMLGSELMKNGITVQEITIQSIKTKYSFVSLIEKQVRIKSQNGDELLVISRCLQKFGKKYELP